MGRYGLARRSAVRNRRMRRLRAVAAIVALAVIWLGYSVVHEMAVGRPEHPSVELQTASGTSTSSGVTTAGAQLPGQSASVGRALPPVPNVAGADILPGTVDGATVPASTETSVAPPALQGALPTSLSHVPFLQAALFDAQAGAAPGADGRPGGAFGGGAVPPMSGYGGAGGGASAGSPAASGDAAVSGDGKPSVLGHRFLAESGEPNEGTSSNENESNGSNGSNGSSGGSNDQNGDANGNNGSNGNGSNDQNGDGNGNNGKNADNGSNAGDGSNGDNGSNGGNGSNGSSENGGSNQGGNGGDQGGVTEGGINTLAISLVDESSTTTGGNDVRDVPEPGSILLGLGALAVLARRRTR